MSGVLHLDPKGLLALLALSDRELRVVLAILSLAPDGELTANEGRLAKRAGLTGTKELHKVLDRLATGLASKGRPVVARDTVRKHPRVRLIGPAGLLVNHPMRGTATPKASTAPKAAPAPKPTVGADALELDLARRKENVRTEHGKNLADLTEAWVAHLASLAPERRLPAALAILQWDAVAELTARYGVEAALTALRAGLVGVKDLGKRPDQYLRTVARSSYVETPSGGRRRHAIIPAAPDEEFPL